MANGHAVALPPQLEPSSSTDTPIELRIGEVTANAAIMACQELEEMRNGGLSAATRAAAGEMIAQLYELQQVAPSELDFSAVVRREGKRVLYGRYNAIFRQQRGADIPEGLFDEVITWLIDIVAKVAEVERKLAAH